MGWEARVRKWRTGHVVEAPPPVQKSPFFSAPDVRPRPPCPPTSPKNRHGVSRSPILRPRSRTWKSTQTLGCTPFLPASSRPASVFSPSLPSSSPAIRRFRSMRRSAISWEDGKYALTRATGGLGRRLSRGGSRAARQFSAFARLTTSASERFGWR